MSRAESSVGDPSTGTHDTMRSYMNVSRACFAVFVMGGAAVTVVSIGTLFGVPKEGTYQLALGAVSLIIGLLTGLWVYKHKRSL